jgi:hypothetical protein
MDDCVQLPLVWMPRIKWGKNFGKPVAMCDYLADWVFLNLLKVIWPRCLEDLAPVIQNRFCHILVKYETSFLEPFPSWSSVSQISYPIFAWIKMASHQSVVHAVIDSLSVCTESYQISIACENIGLTIERCASTWKRCACRVWPR